ncbi:Threonine--tRNA ligase, cytoplasmic [Hondaea fermentalgiana]|uniref:threonine--tRNA ligase n=1 Tax=Hondaea fermentalgiana TaxID=2315210 RepID=A0A2R5GBK8_9STRA|nr:Threonine--tRNA ligase, cytoplasmic [Hondaea fermentalgiana]|eukprot:GBG25511.1 Threonine--tRNA ligase, cytoplasmic [Hondaea fermentalgiana]
MALQLAARRSEASKAIVDHRKAVWDAERARQEERGPVLPPLHVREVRAPGEHEVAQGVDATTTAPQDLPWMQAKDLVVARVSFGKDAATSVLADLASPLASVLEGREEEIEAGAGVVQVEGLDFGSPEGRATFWHSSAHVLGHALEIELGHGEIMLDDGPALEAETTGADDSLVAPAQGGFFYDFAYKQDAQSAHGITPEDIKNINKQATKALKGSPQFERLELPADVAREMFRYNERKLEMIERLGPDARLTAYRLGDFIDLCRGPHVPSAATLGRAGHTVLRAAGLNDGYHAQRVYGISFPEKSSLLDWTERTKMASERDHRVLGRKQGLFSFDPVSPGSAFVLPHGTIIYNRLVAMLRDQYAARGYEEVMTPLMYRSSLWKRSGHLQNYKENMFRVSGHADPDLPPANASETEADTVTEDPDLDIAHNHGACAHGPTSSRESDEDEHEMGLKPMNCPGHCVLFAQTHRSFRELPVRIADFSALHRNEASGALGGLTRLRRFHQDDAHIFCLPSQIEEEILSCIDFVKTVYKDLFGFNFKMALSTRPLDGKSIGSDEEWDRAEDALEKVLEATELPWIRDPGEAAFYGPKIDISVTDALGRSHQCATVQLDFQLPERFDLEYVAPDGSRQRPVMIHRAVLGSVERFLAILLEHTNGKWPFWLSPRQVAILPVDKSHVEAAEAAAKQLRAGAAPEADFMTSPSAAGLTVTVDASNNSLAKRVRNAQQAPYSVIGVIGDKEVASRSITLRSNDGATILEEFSLDLAAEQVRLALTRRSPTRFPFQVPSS